MILRPMAARHWSPRLYAGCSSCPTHHLEVTVSLLPGADFTGYRNSFLCYVLTDSFPKGPGIEVSLVYPTVSPCRPVLQHVAPVSSKLTLNDSPALGQITAPVHLQD